MTYKITYGKPNGKAVLPFMAYKISEPTKTINKNTKYTYGPLMREVKVLKHPYELNKTYEEERAAADQRAPAAYAIHL